MKRLKRLTALLLCILMMFPAQSIAVLGETEGRIEENVVIETAEAVETAEAIETAEAVNEPTEGIEELLPSEAVERIEETLPLETLDTEIETESELELEENLRIKETLPLQPLEGGTWRNEMVIYWNPGGVLPDNLATASNAQKVKATATASSAKRGSDSADGLSPSTPVKTLVAALERAQIMQEEEGVIASDITIYAMNPMEISDGQLYILTGGQIRIVSWPGRTYDDETIFYVNGGQLTLINTRLESGKPDTDTKEAGLVLVRGGSLQMGQNVEIDGRIVMDYRDQTEELVWNVATESNASIKAEVATASDALDTLDVPDAGLSENGGEEGAFDLNDYILDSDEETLELLEDSKNASTWREPVIELMEDFYGTEKSYLLDVLGDDSTPQMELVKTLYADAESEEAFMELFALSETTDSSWQLTVETQAAGRLRDTGLTDRMVGSELLTLKTLVATPFNAGIVVYWNPGDELAVPGPDGKTLECPAGDDVLYDGKRPQAPVKTWEKAVKEATGGTIICMQSVNLGSGDASSYVPFQDGSFLISSTSPEVMVTLRSWESHVQPALIVPEGETLVLKDVALGGLVRDGEENYAQIVLIEKGSLILEENVTANKGYIQIDAFAKMKDLVKVTSTDALNDGMVTLRFGGINDNLSYRYVDVVVPWGNLETAVELGGEEEAKAIGKKLNKRFQLHTSNRSADYDGNSKFDWYLRPDTTEDDGNAKPQNLELYTDYYFDAVYLDGVEGRGDDNNYGATCQYPVKTWEQAKTVWETEMKKSIDARGKAKAAKRTAEEIDELYPLPKTIYICGTVTVENTPLHPWTLQKIPDYDGKLITTEVVSHVDIPLSEDGINPVHELPKVLVEVADGVELKVDNVRFRAIMDEYDSITIQVQEGGKLTLTGDTFLTGERLEDGKNPAKEVTLGTHVKVNTGGTFVMDSGWSGAIERRQRGVDASGLNTIVRMDSGEIRENNSFEQSIYDAELTAHQMGAGVVLSDRANFTMNGGAITENTVYARGAGVYMTGIGTTFVMNKGEISSNKMAVANKIKNSSINVAGFGIGIFADRGTILKIGNGTTPADQVVIKENKGYVLNGGGIYTDGTITINKAMISKNQSGGSITSAASYGIGIYVSGNGTLSMEEGQVVGNHSTGIETSGYNSARGAGIYIANISQSASCYIKNSNISENIIGKEYNTDRTNSSGGGIYSLGNLKIEGSVISNNEAQYGAGICFYNNSSGNIKLDIKTTDIKGNIARYYKSSSSDSYGCGGGIYLYGYVSLILNDGTKIFDNEANNSGGGIRMDGNARTNSTIEMISETPEAIQISENKSRYGGGFYVSQVTIKAKNVAIKKNIATNAGGVYLYSSVTAYMKNVIVSENEAKSSGGGFYIYENLQDIQLKDSEVSGNLAVDGAGFYLWGGLSSDSNSKLYLSETAEGNFKLINNHASENGGGIYMASSESLTMNIAGTIQNSAGEQGSNLYLRNNGSMYLLSGNFKQPEKSQRVDGVYSIYLTDYSSNVNKKCFNMSKMSFEKKTKENPEVIYLNTANSFLTYLTTPEYKEDDNDGSFPIDLNKDAFDVGSVIVKPANLAKTEYQTPKDDLSGSDKITINYAPLLNAETNLAYSSGGKLPRRTQLGGFENGNLTNIVLLGEGVYLSGKGSDGHHGTSPVDAVETFGRAKELLKERIQDADADENNEDGFAPFIYICGRVDVKNDQVWDLNHSAPEFDTRNQKYKEAETLQNESVYPAQVRRFTSFVNAPMIRVGDGSTAVKFETECIIIDGMADAVILADQGDKSPVVQVMKNSTVTLTGETQIMNNYYQGMEVYGSLILKGEEKKTNKQLYNHHGYSVRMQANSSIEMQDYSRILAEGEIPRLGTEIGKPAAIYAVGDSVTITMKDSSSIEENSTGNMIRYGILSDNNKTKIVMQNDASIKSSGSGMTHGVDIRGTDQNFTMRDQAQIDGGPKRTIANGVYIGGEESHVEMCDSSQIFNISSYGVFIEESKNSSFAMNMNKDAEDGDSAKIMNTNHCVGIQSRQGFSFSMGKSALLSNANMGGISFVGSSGTEEIKIVMQDSSTISKCKYGFYFTDSNNAPTSISMKNFTAIEQNYFGVYEYGTPNYGIARLNFEMSNFSRISGNEHSGMRFYGKKIYSFEGDGYRNITLKDSSVIGGSSYYNSEKPLSGNGGAGLYSNGPITLQMSGNSKISGNGGSNRNSDYDKANGISLIRNPSHYSGSGTSQITLNGNASICNNRGGIYIGTGTLTFPNPCEIVLDATNGGTPSIENNTDAVYLGAEGILKLQGAALLGDTTYEMSGYEKRSLECYGKLELDGRSNIKGRIYLKDSKHPITMTHKVTDSTRSYHLWLAEGFMSNIVVQPDYVGMMDVTSPDDQFPYFYKDGGDGMAAEEEKPLVRRSPNIVLLGENNVYLSGIGLDTNDGNSPETAVRTFRRAKELLEEGNFTEGANIIICGSPVMITGAGQPEGDDSDWSFDAGGTVTNNKSGRTWKPLVVRYKDYGGPLIQLPAESGYAPVVTFKNITIDGGSKQGIILDSSNDDELLYIGTGKKAILEEGAVFQNNQAVTSGYTGNASLGIRIFGGTLEIDGGIIRNMVRETSYHASGSISIGVAINTQSNTSTYPGRVIMKSGQIVNNQLICPNFYGSTRLGIISLTDSVCELDMSGGLIANNQVVTRTTSAVNAGAIMLYQATAKISGGIIRNNEGGKGSAIYYCGEQVGGGSLILSGGQITGNRTNATDSTNNVLKSQGLYSPVYIEGRDFQLKGGGADVRDNIYLCSINNLIKVSGNIYQPDRKYHVFLYEGSNTLRFRKGSIVVQPDGDVIDDVTPYLPYFQVHSNPLILDRGRTSQSAGTVTNVSEKQCLILMQAVYLDSVKGKDENTGFTPEQAVATFTKAKAVGVSGYGYATRDYYVIYISGKAVNTKDEPVWTLPETAYLCRYTGFPIYEKDGSETVEIELPYYNFLIEPAHPLKLEQIAVYGRRSIDTIENKGDSLINIKPGVQVTVEEGAILGRNYNNGAYLADDDLPDNLISEGGAIRVEAGGELHMNAGIIQDTDAAYGSAIYLGAGKTEGSPLGHLYLTGSPVIDGKVYLDGTGNATAALIEPDGTYKPAAALKISLRNDYNMRPVISHRDGSPINQEQIDYYVLDDAIQGAYDVVKRGDTILELSIRGSIYLDGKDGKETGDGKTPKTAYKTLKQVYESIGNQAGTNGVLVYIVNTVEISDLAEGPNEVVLSNILIKESDGTRYYEGSYQEGTENEIPIRGQVYFKRYVKPNGYDKDNPVYYGFGNDTHKGALFSVADGGKLTLNGIYVDGHSQDSQNAVDVTLVAKGIMAESPLIRVEGTGELKCCRSEGPDNSVPTATLLTNNSNGNNKDSEEDIIGNLNDSDIMEGSSAGIELLNGGTSILQHTQFSNLSLGDQVVSGGTDVYSNGFLHVSKDTFFTGSVYLEGFGTSLEKKDTSRYITVDVFGDPVKTNFKVLMRDSYNGRDVVHFQKGVSPGATDIGLYLLEERVKDFFCLMRRSDEERHILELQVPVSVYIDGSKGVDDPKDRVAGSTPKYPVKTLKRAFDLLETRGGNTIYVVDTVQVTTDAYITGNSYQGNDGITRLGSTNKVHMVRYIQPDFARNNEEAKETEYDVEDFTGVLLNVNDGVTVRFGNNVFLDGHSEPKTDGDYPEEVIVSGNSEAKAPLISVDAGGTLKLETGVTLQDNNNTYHDGDTGMAGGLLYNSGTTTVDGALFANKKATQGVDVYDVYQDGTFTILGEPENLADLSFYLTTKKTGTSESPIWGEDHIIQTAVMIPDGQIFDVDMDHAVKGRDVVRFTDSSAYTPNADAEHEHFRLDNKVPENLFLVQAENDEAVLELQNWELFDVEVPTDIYLAINLRDIINATAKLSGIRTEAEGTSLFSAPEYTIKNKGIYDVQVSVKEFTNQNAEVGITHEAMNLTETSADATNNKDIYLAVKGLDDGSGGTGFTMDETSLKPYAEAVVTEKPAKLGILKAGTDGNFTFVGKVGDGFVEKYLDPDFPIEGKNREEAQQHMDGTSEDGLIHARAKYGLKYKLEMVPSRRGNNITP